VAGDDLRDERRIASSVTNSNTNLDAITRMDLYWCQERFSKGLKTHESTKRIVESIAAD
jgi:hypothetical protein